MATRDLTLAETLKKISILEGMEDRNDREIEKETRGKKFRGEFLKGMDANRMLYFVSSYETMEKTAFEIVKEYEGSRYHVLDICSLGKENTLTILAMKNCIALKAENRAHNKAIQALQDYSKTFDDADFKRIRKEKSIFKLKELGLM